MLRKAGFEVTKAGFEVAKAGLEVTKASLEVTKASLEVTKASLEVAKAGFEVAKAGFEVAKAGFEVAKAGLMKVVQTFKLNPQPLPCKGRGARIKASRPFGATVYTQVELPPLIPPMHCYGVYTSQITPLNPPL
ncbi:hypothetical protein [Nostoc favosum]|uniref:Uncharacterized protein n=1 Tax=Nostoc favosum CHAB5714 TaxID=2780399 RepID=A0ABS8I894_9NOSO|nr:hypothetical protein [Nostoc favosum]MCC5600398.1 hypothetical protein [Nostoc favosum CHAB5714]